MLRACDDPRLLDSLRHNCGPLIMGALEDAEVIEIMLNPDGSLWIERYGQDHERIGVIPPAQGRLILSLTASGLDITVNDRNPIVEGEFPLDGSRFEGRALSYSPYRAAAESGIITCRLLPLLLFPSAAHNGDRLCKLAFRVFM
jgi:hypothetical protein